MTKKSFTSIIALFLFSLSLFAQDTLPEKKTYPLVIQFQSLCCGVPNDAPVRKAIRSFRKQYKIKRISADKIGPMGREGEYYLAFSLKELNKKQRALFIKKLEKVIPLLTDKGQATLEKNLTLTKADLPSNLTIERIIFN